MRDAAVLDEPVLTAIDDVHAAIECERLQHEQRLGERYTRERHRRFAPREIEVVVPKRHQVVGDRCEPYLPPADVLGDGASFCEAHVENEELERERCRIGVRRAECRQRVRRPHQRGQCGGAP
jgi:hypothetical protein